MIVGVKIRETFVRVQGGSYIWGDMGMWRGDVWRLGHVSRVRGCVALAVGCGLWAVKAM